MADSEITYRKFFKACLDRALPHAERWEAILSAGVPLLAVLVAWLLAAVLSMTGTLEWFEWETAVSWKNPNTWAVGFVAIILLFNVFVWAPYKEWKDLKLQLAPALDLRFKKTSRLRKKGNPKPRKEGFTASVVELRLLLVNLCHDKPINNAKVRLKGIWEVARSKWADNDFLDRELTVAHKDSGAASIPAASEERFDLIAYLSPTTEFTDTEAVRKALEPEIKYYQSDVTKKFPNRIPREDYDFRLEISGDGAPTEIKIAKLRLNPNQTSYDLEIVDEQDWSPL